MLKCTIDPYTLCFAFEARTSRETFHAKQTYFITVTDDEGQRRGVGEVPVFPSLQPSFSTFGAFETELHEAAQCLEDFIGGKPMPRNSAIRFGIESALAAYRNGDKYRYADPAQLELLKDGIRINGLIWMDTIDGMLRQIEKKIADGFTCLKLKIGANNFNDEVALLRAIRDSYSDRTLTVRLDANGAFQPSDVMATLDCLAPFDIHSIEQPLPRDNTYIADVCRQSPIPVALDEDMIERWFDRDGKYHFLNRIRPQYIIIKPSLIGGFREADEWVEIAENCGIGWWATSALESNVGLAAIAAWLSRCPANIERMPHGLGTGQIYTNNISDVPIRLVGERLYLT